MNWDNFVIVLIIVWGLNPKYRVRGSTGLKVFSSGSRWWQADGGSSSGLGVSETERKLEEFLEESLKWGHDCHEQQRDNLALVWSPGFMEGVAWWVPGDFCCGGPAQPVKHTRCLREIENLVPKNNTSLWHLSESGFQICYNSTSHTWIEIKCSEWTKNEFTSEFS